MAKVQVVRARVLGISVGREQYKPYNYTLEPENLFVELPLNPDEVITFEKDGEVVITCDGFAAVLGKLADSIESMHKEYIYKQTGVKR